MMSWRHVVIGTFAIVALTGCAVAQTDEDSGTGQDAGNQADVVRSDTGTRSDGGSRDTGSGGRDVVFSLGDSGGGGGGGTVPLYGACGAATDCRDMGAGCLQAFPGGICTKQCTTDGDCGSGHCIQMICLPDCTSGGGQCTAIGGTCASISSTSSACLPACFASGAPAGWPTCGGGTTCDPYSTGCTTMPSTGADNGAACTADADCRGGRCITELDTTTTPATPSGFLGGYCVSFGRYPGDAAYVSGSPIPQSNCPTGSGIIPIGMPAEGDSVACLKTCTSNSQCRSGFTCSHLQDTTGANFSSNGTCLPLDCSMTGMTCPSGTHCVNMTGSSGTAYGVCAH